MNILGISRSPQFATHDAGAEHALFMAVASRLQKAGHDVSTINEDLFVEVDFDEFDLVFSMARGRTVVNELIEAARQGTMVVGSPENLEALPHSPIREKGTISFEGVSPSYYFKITEGETDRSEALQIFAEEQAARFGQPVYGGSVRMEKDGTFSLLSLEDWPAFADNRKNAAKAIAAMIVNH